MTDHLDPSIVEKIVLLHTSLADGGVEHAFGGALALGWCVAEARGTVDVDVNVFMPADRAAEVVQHLPTGVDHTDDDIALLERDGQARLWWGRTPIDLFFNTTEFHERAATRAHWERFGGTDLPFLACRDLAVFKAFFNRPKDWVDLQAMTDVGMLDRQAVLGVLVDYLGTADERIERLRTLTPQPEGEPPRFG
ncbi:MAG: hypothetical protein ACT452_19275 [Microthrixaceae bacterium]